MTICYKCDKEVEDGTGWMDEHLWDALGVVGWLCEDCLFDTERERINAQR